MTNKIKFKIVTPERVVYESEVDQVTLPTTTGEITVLPNHIPLVSVLTAGELVAKKNGEEVAMAVSGGFVEVSKNQIIVLADTAEHHHEIDEMRAEEARKKAEQLMRDLKDKDDVQYTNMAAQLEKELARLRVARKRKRRNV